MKLEREFRFVAEKVYTIPGRGVVVGGRVEKGLVSVGDEIGFLATDGKFVRTMVTAIESSRQLVQQIEAGKEASLLLQGVRKKQITPGMILTEVPEAPPGPVSPSPPETRPAQVTLASPTPYSPQPLHPSSSLWRTILYIVIGLLVLLALLFYLGKWDPKKWDPKKWDPRKKLASIQLSEGRGGVTPPFSA